MFSESLRPKTGETLNLLTRHGWLSDFYLAGGTGLALHLGHRISEDLDFFSPISVDSKSLRERLFDLGSIRVEMEKEGTLWVTLNETKLSFIEYHYPLIEPVDDYQGCRLASMKDIACMKLDVLSSRGSRKDFIDLYFVMKVGHSLQEIFLWFERKFRGIEYNKGHLLKSLIFFDDAEREPELQMLKHCQWSDVKRFFEQEAKRIVV